MANRKKNAAAVALGRLGGLKGGKARAAKLTAAERSASARRAVVARRAKSKTAGRKRIYMSGHVYLVPENKKRHSRQGEEMNAVREVNAVGRISYNDGRAGHRGWKRPFSSWTGAGSPSSSRAGRIQLT